MNRDYFQGNAVFRINSSLDIILTTEHLPPLRNDGFVQPIYIAPVVPVTPMYDNMNKQTESPIYLQAVVTPTPAPVPDIRTAQVFCTKLISS